MTVTLEKLRALRQQAGEPLAGKAPDQGRIPPGPFAAPTPGTQRPDPGAQLDALRRLLGVRQRHSPSPVISHDRSVPGTQIEPGLYLAESERPMQAPPSVQLAFAKRDDAVDTDALLFFDTETTGLAGGTGTRAFMIGAADWSDGMLRIRQLTITTLAAEPAMLRTFAQWLTPRTVLCSYNGRCYDAPLLKTRFRLARMGDPISALDHVDLLFPTRRRYRGVWENCRLATIEREALRIVREDDLPGSEAPAAWLSFLRGGSSANLRRVAEHNLQDVVTLGRLFVHLAEAA
ncbi:ribonuclease H-like domain-containing protein [Lysobacter sp. S4-A87]|uniref:ribonuclease H-like domain-containing protein n=1 Tax=Lysobacter sp. S4-A87 TaxID=2925843 RepID=UPI001F536C80|nr:ribonuclease H-like domain-containing protein [Lysobacter sp. S4-A87]UNK50568.1 ribonuclease H-like domain-containing protein [Lysobacter sp. S4-A87]